MDVLLPKLNTNDNSAIIGDIFVSSGDFVKKGTVLMQVEDTKSVFDIEAPIEGYIKLLCEQMDNKETGKKLAIIFDNKEDCDAFSVTADEVTNEAIPALNITKKAMELAQKTGVDLEKLAKIKNGALIKTEDVQNFNSDDSKISFLKARINQFDRERVVLIGAGKGAEIVIDILMDNKDKYIVGIVDTYEKEFNSYSYPMLACGADNFPEFVDPHYFDTVILTIGSSMKTMSIRKKFFEDYIKKGIKFTNAIADNTCIRRATRLGVGNIIPHNCYFGTGTNIGDNNMFSYNVSIGHHCTVGSHNLFAPSVSTAGCVSIGDSCVLSTGVNTRNDVIIGSNVVLPLGYSVNVDISDGTIIRDGG